jgi:hypothetical protein
LCCFGKVFALQKKQLWVRGASALEPEQAALSEPRWLGNLDFLPRRARWALEAGG